MGQFSTIFNRSGIGRAAALAWACEGVRLVVADVDDQGGAQTVAAIQTAGGEAHYVRTDVSREEDCSAAVGEALRRFGRLDVAFNNAGISGPSARISSYSLSAWRHVIDVNLTGIFNCMQAELKVFEQAGAGVIVNTSSVIGLRGVAGGAAYCAAKHGVIGLTKCAAIEYASRGIRINAICPGYIETPMLSEVTSGLPNEVMREKIARTAAKRLGTAQEVAALAVWLASDAASYVNGAAMVMDGGYLVS